MKNPTKDNKSTLDKWSDDDEIKKISTSENRKEPKVVEENIKEISLINNSVDSKDIKFKDNEIGNKITQSTSDETKESKWDKIDWNKTNSVERGESKWDKIDWTKPYSEEEKKENKWDRIDCSKDYSFEEKKIEGYKNDNIDDNMIIMKKLKILASMKKNPIRMTMI